MKARKTKIERAENNAVHVERQGTLLFARSAQEQQLLDNFRQLPPQQRDAYLALALSIAPARRARRCYA